jgi:PAS domain S-box-containing protein
LGGLVLFFSECGISKVVVREKEITEMNEFAENLIETAQDAIVCIDDKRIINIWNQSAENIFGYTKSEIIGQLMTNIVPARILGEFLHMSKIIKISRVLEITGMTKCGIMVPIEMSISSCQIEEGRSIFTLIIRDITFQKEAKRQLIERADMLAARNRELEEFVYIVSHDLKEPLFVIEGYVSKLYRAYKDIYDDKGKLYTDRIRENVKTMSQKIHEIMEVLKVGRIAYDFRNTDIGAIVKGVVDSLERRIRAEEVNVTIEDNFPNVNCDGERMKDVFSNLITNAIKYMGNGKHTKTPHNTLTGKDSNGRSGRIRIGCHEDEYCYKFFIEDTGIGIREEHKEQIFKIFRRLKVVETEGTGVGLAIVKKIVESHAGKLWVESPVKDGKGSRFCFTIPKAKRIPDHQGIQSNS